LKLLLLLLLLAIGLGSATFRRNWEHYDTSCMFPEC